MSDQFCYLNLTYNLFFYRNPRSITGWTTTHNKLIRHCKYISHFPDTRMKYCWFVPAVFKRVSPWRAVTSLVTCDSSKSGTAALKGNGGATWRPCTARGNILWMNGQQRGLRYPTAAGHLVKTVVIPALSIWLRWTKCSLELPISLSETEGQLKKNQ